MRGVLEEREARCFEFLGGIPQGAAYVLVGGFAVSAYEFPRFSVDLDIVVDRAEAKVFADLAQKQGFVPDEVPPRWRGAMQRFRRGEKNPTHIDLLLDGLAIRQTGAFYPYAYLRDHSGQRAVTGFFVRHRAEAQVVERELLIALKIHSGRDQDVRDVLALCFEAPDWKKVLAHMRQGLTPELPAQVKSIADATSSLDADALKGAFGIQGRGVVERMASNARGLLGFLRSEIR